MSALGQKQTFALQQVMSALPPKAGHVRCNWRCLLWANSGHRWNDVPKQKDRLAAVSPKSDQTAIVTSLWFALLELYPCQPEPCPCRCNQQGQKL